MRLDSLSLDVIDLFPRGYLLGDLQVSNPFANRIVALNLA